MNQFFAGIEAGGTKFKCIIAKDPSTIIAEAVFPTMPGSRRIIIQYFYVISVKLQF